MNDVPSYKERPNGQQAPGDPALKNILKVHWDPQAQAATLEFDPTVFRSWEFVEAVLAMAGKFAEQRKREAYMAALQRQAMEAQTNQVIAQKVSKGGILRG